MKKEELIARKVDLQRTYFQSGKTKSFEERLIMLRTFRNAVKANEQEIMAALKEDLSKSELEAYSTEIGILLEEINFTMKHLRKWMKPERVKTALTHFGSRGRIVPEPYGSTLIIAPWNYPFQLALSPLVGAIAAGNTAIIKPSEFAPAVSRLLSKMISQTFPEGLVTVIEGDVETNKLLLAEKFDYIFFTGSVPVGKIVMEAASKHLTPVTLELGGKSPCIVNEDANLKLAARRIVFGKFTNAGQTCIAPDYLYVHHSVKDELIRLMKEEIRSMFGERPIHNEEYSKIISQRHFERLAGFLGEGLPLTGGKADPKILKIEPTLLGQTGWNSQVMKEEIFGPIFPVLEYQTLEEAITQINSRPKPLALYLFTESKKAEAQVIEQIPFGGGCINDALMHIATPYLPFGGVGESGMGSYHGAYSFKTFSHYKSVLKQTTAFDFSFRYPNNKNALKIVRKLLK